MGGQKSRPATAQAEPTTEQKWADYFAGKLKELASEMDQRSEQQDGRIHALDKQLADAFGQVSRQEEQQDSRITELENRCFKAEGQIADHGFRIADHDHQLNHSGITGTAKRWPVVTSQILAAAFNVLVILPAAVWDYLPAPWPLVIGAVLQAVAAVIGGQLTESKAELARLQDGQRVAPLPKPKPIDYSQTLGHDQARQDMKDRFTHPMDPADKVVPPIERYGASAFKPLKYSETIGSREPGE